MLSIEEEDPFEKNSDVQYVGLEGGCVDSISFLAPWGMVQFRYTGKGGEFYLEKSGGTQMYM